MTPKTLPAKFSAECTLPSAPLRTDNSAADLGLICPDRVPAGLERCAFTADLSSPEGQEAWVEHMATVHNRRPAPDRAKLGVGWRAPKPKDAPAKREALAEKLGPITWCERGDDELFVGQYWSDAPGKGRIWVIPTTPHPAGYTAVLLEERGGRRSFVAGVSRQVVRNMGVRAL